jgi:hypothetical protein
MSEITKGDGYAVGHIDDMGDRFEDGTTHILVAGGKDGYVGRDGRLPEGEQRGGGPVP